MKTILILLISAVTVWEPSNCQRAGINAVSAKQEIKKTIFVYGAGPDTILVKYIISLTHKQNPKICFIPTASAESEASIISWYTLCAGLPVRPYVLRTFINSVRVKKSFEEVLLGYDAIIVGGGNTLNMLAIWKAQGIDLALKKAYDKGIVLAGGSAGSLCWFTGGYTDSRPKELTLMKCLGFLDYSHSPHYHGEPDRRPLYLQAISDHKLGPGYACDDKAGLLFINGKMAISVSENPDNNNYYVSVKGGKLIEEKIISEIIK